MQDLVPGASCEEIDSALSISGGNIDIAAGQLLDDLDMSDDVEILETLGISGSSNSKEISNTDSLRLKVTLEDFRNND